MVRGLAFLLSFIGMLLYISSFVHARQPSIDIHGYFENRLYALFDDRAALFRSFNNINHNTTMGDMNRFRVRFEAQPSKRVHTNLTVDYFTYHGLFKEITGLLDPSGKEDPEQVEQLIRIDRAFVQFYFSHLDITMGMQRIAWGRSILWSPFDVFRRVNILNPQEETQGVNALKIVIPLSQLTTIQAVYQPEDKLGASPAALRFMTTVGMTDIAATVIHFENEVIEQIIYGFDFKGEYFLGWWLELAWHREETSGSNFLRSIIGIDYTFNIANGLFVKAEYYRDESGVSNKIYDYSTIINRRRFTLSRDYLFITMSYPLKHNFMLSYSVVGNLNDGTMVHIPSLRWELLPNCEAIVGSNILAGPTGGEFHPHRGPYQPAAAGRHAAYIWLRIYF